MSNYTRKLLVRGLLFAACAGLRAGGEARSQEPAPTDRAEGVAPKAAEERYLLMTDGRLIKGVISQQGSSYLVKQRIGAIPVPKRQVERAFDSVREAYAYRLERIPDDDPAERLKLARWCLSWHLDAEARKLVEQVVEISPEHGPARAMLTSMVQTEAARMARRETKVDEGVRKTAGEEVAEDRPGALDSAVLRGAERRMGITGLPVIFDLPPAMAVQRAEHFQRYVHPILQAYCAKCHNETYNGPFQLVPVKSARDRRPDAIRANLDATLRLIDRETPERSELLSSSLRPHGVGGKGRPIFSGSNDRYYQVLAVWVASLRPVSAAEAAPAPRSGESDEDFAADRDRKGARLLDEMTRRIQLDNPRQAAGMRGPAPRAEGGRSYRYVEGQGMVPEESGGADPREFPLPYMMGGPKPTLPGAGSNRAGGRGASDAPKDAVVPGRSADARPRKETLPSDAERIDPTAEGSTRPAAGDVPGAPSAKKKPVKIDPKILEKFLQRNAAPPAGQ